MVSAGVQTWGLNAGMVGTPHNGKNRCRDLGIQHKDGGDPSKWAEQEYKPGNSVQGLWELLIMGTEGGTDLGNQHRDGEKPS